MGKGRRQAVKRLYEIAEGQQGFFTTKQAKAAGFAENTHPYHVQTGNWIREHCSIYRLANFPQVERPDLNALVALVEKSGRGHPGSLQPDGCRPPATLSHSFIAIIPARRYDYCNYCDTK